MLHAMTTVPALIDAVRDFATRAGLHDTTASLWVFNDGKRLEQLAAGEVSITLKRLAKAKAQLRELEANLKRGIKVNPHVQRARQRAEERVA